MGYDGSLKFDTEINEKGFSASIKKIGSIAKGGLAVIGGSVVGVATAFGVMTKNALDSYANLEQNIGGIETLFKDSSQKVIDSAKNAYKTAGLSANAYMETVTSFSASLLQSLENDTEKAADYADRAITDMSDNANKMGTSMEMIQNAYQGFAKQNYTMLDNLKLGYGGTKEEMARLVSDASKLTDVQNELGITVDENSLSFANIVNAISVMQKHMGITGTTAKEASETISGSIATAKGAFDNFLNGTGSPEALAESFVTAGKNVLKGLREIVPRLLQTLPEVKKLIQENLVNSLSGDNLQKVVESGKNLAASIVRGITENTPILVQKGFELLSNLVNGFVKAIPAALPKILDFTQGIGDKLAEAAPVMIQKGFELLQKLVEGIVTAVPILIARVPEIISTFANIINDNFPTILMKGVQLLGQLVMGLIQAVPTLIANIPKIIRAIVDTLMAFQWLNLGRNIIKFLGDGIGAMKDFVVKKGFEILTGLKNALLNLPSTLANIGKSAMHGLGNTISGLVSYVKTAALKIVSGIESAILTLPGKMLSIGKNIVQGLWDGISDMTGWVISKIQGFGESVLGGIKDFFGIKSPSRLMRDEVGKYMAQGIGVGFEKNIPVKQMTKSMKKAVGYMQTSALQVMSTMPVSTNIATKAVTNNYTNMQIDYKKIKKAQLEANNESNERPVVLNTRQVNRALKDGGYQPAW